jgi:hypothetical protein
MNLFYLFRNISHGCRFNLLLSICAATEVRVLRLNYRNMILALMRYVRKLRCDSVVRNSECPISCCLDICNFVLFKCF